MTLRYLVVDFLEGEDLLDTFSSWLSTEEKGYVNSFRLEHDQKGRIIVRGLARLLLASLESQGPEYFTLLKKESGQVISNESKYFLSFSHTPRFAAVAISDQPCGIDIEDANRKLDVEAISRRFFNEKEYLEIKEKKDLFFRYWTAKEAFLKREENEIDKPLKDIVVSPDFASIVYEGERSVLVSKQKEMEQTFLVVSIVGHPAPEELRLQDLLV